MTVRGINGRSVEVSLNNFNNFRDFKKFFDNIYFKIRLQKNILKF